MDATQTSPNSAPAPVLFGKSRALFGWQGFSMHLPAEWNPGKFSGTRAKGELRVDDPNGVRLELSWEKVSGKTPDVAKSVRNFTRQIEKHGKRSKNTLKTIENPSVISRKRTDKTQIHNFGWIGDPNSTASCGYGFSWYCPVCERVTFGHLIGQKNERPGKIEALAREIFSELECHGTGGWETWSAFDFAIDVPVEFELKNAKILLNKLDLEWIRPRPISFQGWGRRAERLRLQRFPVANVLLDGKTLEEWSDWNIVGKNKVLSVGSAQETLVKGHEGLLYEGSARDFRSRWTVKIFDKILRRTTPAAQIRVWNCTQSNRIFAFESEISSANIHVPNDALDGLACH